MVVEEFETVAKVINEHSDMGLEFWGMADLEDNETDFCFRIATRGL